MRKSLVLVTGAVAVAVTLAGCATQASSPSTDDYGLSYGLSRVNPTGTAFFVGVGPAGGSGVVH